MIESDHFALALTLKPEQGAEARTFLQNVLNTAKRVDAVRANNQQQIEAAKQALKEVNADTSAIDNAKNAVENAVADTTEVDAALALLPAGTDPETLAPAEPLYQNPWLWSFAGLGLLLIICGGATILS